MQTISSSAYTVQGVLSLLQKSIHNILSPSRKNRSQIMVFLLLSLPSDIMNINFIPISKDLCTNSVTQINVLKEFQQNKVTFRSGLKMQGYCILFVMKNQLLVILAVIRDFVIY